MKIHVTLSRTLNGTITTVPRIEIDRGEPLSIPLLNLDGSPWDTTNSSVRTYPTYSTTQCSPEPCSITGGAVQMTALASAALAPGQYMIQVWKASGVLATDGSADIGLSVH